MVVPDDGWLVVHGMDERAGLEHFDANVVDVPGLLLPLAVYSSRVGRICGIDYCVSQDHSRAAVAVKNLRGLEWFAETRARGTRPDSSTLFSGYIPSFYELPLPPHEGQWYSLGDHRMAMAGVCLALGNPNVVVYGVDCISKSFPGFLSEIERLQNG